MRALKLHDKLLVPFVRKALVDDLKVRSYYPGLRNSLGQLCENDDKIVLAQQSLDTINGDFAEYFLPHSAITLSIAFVNVLWQSKFKNRTFPTEISEPDLVMWSPIDILAVLCDTIVDVLHLFSYNIDPFVEQHLMQLSENLERDRISD